MLPGCRFQVKSVGSSGLTGRLGPGNDGLLSLAKEKLGCYPAGDNSVAAVWRTDGLEEVRPAWGGQWAVHRRVQGRKRNQSVGLGGSSFRPLLGGGMCIL